MGKPISVTTKKLSTIILGKEEESSGDTGEILEHRETTTKYQEECVEDDDLVSSLENTEGHGAVMNSSTAIDMKDSKTRIINEIKNSQTEMRTEIKNSNLEIKNTLLTEMERSQAEIRTEFTEVKQRLADLLSRQSKID